MKVTDVIFLGAGASVGAGFPVNAQLTDYIIDGLHLSSVPGEYSAIREKLRKTNITSVDEFCQISRKDEDVQLMKLIAAVALVAYSTKQQNWRSTQNIYRSFLATLFPGASVFPESRFFIVNFNYDGLVGKMLVDAVRARRGQSKEDATTDMDVRLSAMNGGYLHSKDSLPVKRCDMNIHTEKDIFRQILPHGTYCVWEDVNDSLISLQKQIYPETANPSAQDLWNLGWQQSAAPQIDFPWEQDCESTKFHRQQMTIAAEAVLHAKRIHFIGLQGHPLMRHTLGRIFSAVSAAGGFGEKEWHIATKESDPERVFFDISSCFLPEAYLKDYSLRYQTFRRKRVHFYSDFANWIYKRPHHPSRVEDGTL